MKKVKVVNRTRQAVLASQAEMADSIWSRFMGLMGRRELNQDAGLVIYPNNGVHMFFMRFGLDILHVAVDGTLLKAVKNLKPWRVGPIVKGCKYTVELPVGTVERTGTRAGDSIELVNE